MGWQGVAVCSSVIAGGSDEDLTTISEITDELDARGLTLARMNALFRFADGLSAESSYLTNTYAHANGTSEADALAIAASEYSEIVKFDMTNITQTTTIKTYEEVDGSNRRLVDSAEYPTDFPTNAKVVVIELPSTNRDVAITFTSAVAEGASRNVPYTRRRSATI